MHQICEARDRDALSTGLQVFKSRLARMLNQELDRSGAIFEERYHARALANPTATRNALRYVLNNRRHHAAERGERLAPHWFDPFSSAAWFAGWSTPPVFSTKQERQLAAMPAPTALAETWLLAIGWKRVGLIAIDEIPGCKRALRRLLLVDEELEHQARMNEIDLEWRCMHGELLREPMPATSNGNG